MADVALVVRDCPCCDGVRSVQASRGTGVEPCEECDGTGAKYRATWTTDDGVTCSMSGSGRRGPDANDRALMELVCSAPRESDERDAAIREQNLSNVKEDIL